MRSTLSQQSASALADAYERGVQGVDLAQVMLEIAEGVGVVSRADRSP
jgi:hypothetical protein